MTPVFDASCGGARDASLASISAWADTRGPRPRSGRATWAASSRQLRVGDALADECLVYLDDSAKLAEVSATCFTEPVQHEPGGFLRDADFLRELQAAHALARRHHEIHGVEPEAQRDLATLHNRPGPHREFRVAGIAMMVFRPRARRDPVAVADRTARTVRPAPFLQIASRRSLIGEQREKLVGADGDFFVHFFAPKSLRITASSPMYLATRRRMSMVVDHDGSSADTPSACSRSRAHSVTRLLMVVSCCGVVMSLAPVGHTVEPAVTGSLCVLQFHRRQRGDAFPGDRRNVSAGVVPGFSCCGSDRRAYRANSLRDSSSGARPVQQQPGPRCKAALVLDFGVVVVDAVDQGAAICVLAHANIALPLPIRLEFILVVVISVLSVRDNRPFILVDFYGSTISEGDGALLAVGGGRHGVSLVRRVRPLGSSDRRHSEAVSRETATGWPLVVVLAGRAIAGARPPLNRAARAAGPAGAVLTLLHALAYGAVAAGAVIPRLGRRACHYSASLIRFFRRDHPCLRVGIPSCSERLERFLDGVGVARDGDHVAHLSLLGAPWAGAGCSNRLRESLYGFLRCSQVYCKGLEMAYKSRL